MSKLQLLNVFLTERLTAAAVEIFGVVERTVVEYQDEITRTKEENKRLQRQLDLVLKPEIKLHRADSRHLTLSVCEKEEQHSDQEWSSSLGQEEPQPKKIKEEQDLRTSRGQEPQMVESDINFRLSCVSDCGRSPPQPSHLYQIQTVEDSERNDLSPTVAEHIKTEPGEDGCEVSEPTSDSPRLSEVNPDCSVAQSEKVYHCHVCNTYYAKKATLTSHMRVHTMERPYRCHVCGKLFKMKTYLKRHTRLHTGERPYTCHVCGKHFKRSNHMVDHVRSTHKGKSPYRCDDCGECFTHLIFLRDHVATIHTRGEAMSAFILTI